MSKLLSAAPWLAILLTASTIAQARNLTFDERVRAQEALARVTFSHQTGAHGEFESAVPRAAIERIVRTYLAKSRAVEILGGTPITEAMLQAELDRMALGTQMPARLLEYFGALGNDPFLIAECLARPAVADRLSREKLPEFAKTLEAARDALAPPEEVRAVATVAIRLPSPRMTKAAFDPGAMQRSLSCAAENTWDSASLSSFANVTQHGRAVWTGSEIVVVGYLGGVRYDPGTDAWHTIAEVGPEYQHGGQSAVWTGTRVVVWGGNCNKTGAMYDPVSDTWTPMSTSGAPVARHSHEAVWTGQKMLVWGGNTCTAPYVTNTGGIYDPITNVWTPMTTVGAPSARNGAKLAWAGDRLVTWGGSEIDSNGNGVHLATGGIYAPATDQWTATSMSGAPTSRSDHAMTSIGSKVFVWGGSRMTPPASGALLDPVLNVWTPVSTAGAPANRERLTSKWTGSAVLVWGGYDRFGQFIEDGSLYDPVMGAWTPIATTDGPGEATVGAWTGNKLVLFGTGSGSTKGSRYDLQTNTWQPMAELPRGGPPIRESHAAVWTGGVMIVWGGYALNAYLQDGSRYDPALDLWSPITLTNAPTARYGHTAVWSGDKMIVWGGAGVGVPFDTGGVYDPIQDSWSPIASSPLMPRRAGHTAVWTGDRMIVWGGKDGATPLDSGGIYDPDTSTWSQTSRDDAPTPRERHASVWTGSRMIVWGGIDWTPAYVRSGAQYDPLTNTWTATNLTGSPSSRARPSVVWTGSRAIFWGGVTATGAYLQSGAQYDPGADAWTATASTGAPTGRTDHSASWTGDRMIVWGGRNGSAPLNTGALFDPSANTWNPTPTQDVPLERYGHTGVWTGSGLVVWGGTNGASLVVGGGRFVRGLEADNDADGVSECAGDCNDGNAAVAPGAPELCDNLDNDCDGVADEGFDVPGPVAGLAFDDETTLSWTPEAVADRYDTARGSIGALRSASGDFGAALTSCLLDDGPTASVQDLASPASGDAFFYLVRAGNGCKRGSYDTAAAAQPLQRDATLTACP